MNHFRLLEVPLPYSEHLSDALYATLPHQQRTATHTETPSAYNPSTLLLLESADITTRQGENSMAVLKASLRLTCTDNTVSVDALSATGEALRRNLERDLSTNCRIDHHTLTFERSTAVDERARLLAASTVQPLRYLQTHPNVADERMPFVGGVFSFDYLASFENLPAVAPGVNTCPDYQFVVAEILLSINHQKRVAHLLGLALDEEADTLHDQMTALAADLENAVQHAGLDPHTEAAPNQRHPTPPHNATTADQPEPSPLHGETAAENPQEASSNSRTPLRATADMTDAAFGQAVEQLKQAITQGEIYQVVPARTFSLPCPNPPAAYLALKQANPSPYMFFMRGIDQDGHSFDLFGASPESNLKFDAHTRELSLYPIAGTRARGLNADRTLNHELDTRAELELRTDAKEIAEHTMLVDLARNDVARVSAPGTRQVRKLLGVDRYEFVMHLVSQVTGRLADGLDALDAYRACMNMGTLTGAPKIRATELLRGVEGVRRGSYGGAIGYLRGDGNFDTCIVIRSAFVRAGTAYVQAGAGVVRDSNPQSEADETLNKARAVLESIASAQNTTVEVTR